MRDLHEPQVLHDETLFGFQAAADLPATASSVLPCSAASGVAVTVMLAAVPEESLGSSRRPTAVCVAT